MPLDYVLPLLNDVLPTAKKDILPTLPYLVPSLEDLQELEGSMRLHLGEGSDERPNEGLVAATESRVGWAIIKIRIIRQEDGKMITADVRERDDRPIRSAVEQEVFKGTVQRDLRGFKSGYQSINLPLIYQCFALISYFIRPPS
jgi:hypothetical protein